MGAGVVLSPIAGALGTLGLKVPYYVSAGISALAFLWAALAWKEAKQLRAAKRMREAAARGEDAELARDSKSAASLSGDEAPRGSPFCDVVVWLMVVAHWVVLTVMVGLSLL